MNDFLEQQKTANPFYDNHIFSKADIERAIIKWWQYPFLWLLPTYCQISEGYVFKYKLWNGAYYLMGFKPLPQTLTNER